MKLGYARISTLEQSLNLQVDALERDGCEKIYKDTVSGSKSSRPGLDELLEFARSGDQIVVWKLDRLGRSLKNLIELVNGLNERGVELRVLEGGIDTSTPTGRMMFHIFGTIAEFERELIRERTLAGLTAARARGRNGGRKAVLNQTQARHYALIAHNDQTQTITSLCKGWKISRATFYRMVQPEIEKLKASSLPSPE
jgi:DNA invertase Pin-like site-specific DNA recombinase